RYLPARQQLDGPDRHVLGLFPDRRLPRAGRDGGPVRRGLDVDRRHDRHRGAPPLPPDRPVGQLAERPHHRAVPADIRATDLSEEPVPEAEAVQARPVPREGHAQADRTASKARNLESARTRGSAGGLPAERGDREGENAFDEAVILGRFAGKSSGSTISVLALKEAKSTFSWSSIVR